MASASATPRKRRPSSSRESLSARPSQGWGVVLGLVSVILGSVLVYGALQWHATYAVSLQAPVKLQVRWPLVVSRRTDTSEASFAQLDQRHPLTVYQQYTCSKFGSACRVALAIQRAENPQGKCDLYHYNTDGTLDWGYFQINTVHLRRPGVALRDLLDCRTNVDFAYRLYSEEHGFMAWSSYRSGSYRKFLQQ